ncbi:LLM class flavin-dependent oxidoreductase [Streptomyces sp. NPDC057474]|uniref:LLM class flavin-dependent oxidoreductase n=1 Tax=Streptomyces sp. NPDC057474 TaxID=3346144 RepID=UPI00367ADE2A
MTDYEFNVLVETPFPNAPYAPKRKSNYIDLPNTHYDKVLGQHALDDQLHTIRTLEDLGFDGVIVSEQHNGPIGSLGNPMLAAAYAAASTRRIRIGVVGPIINDYLSPLRLAEEIATLDTMSRGRFFFGLPMGHGMQYHSTGVMNPATSRRRFREAHDLLMAAFTRPGPFEWKGEFFNIPYVNLWPKPLQEPHPTVFIPGGGSVETLQLVAKHRYVYQAALSPRAGLLRTVETLRNLCREEGYEMDPRQLALVVTVHVAESDEQARREAEAHELWTYQNFFRSAPHDVFPPGYISETSLRRAMAGGYRSTPISELSYDQIVDNGWLIAGSPETVARKLKDYLDEMGAARLVLGMNSGTKPRWLADKSMTLFAEEVIPRLRPGGLPPEHEGRRFAFETNSEFGARRPTDATAPTASFGTGGLVDVSTAHVPELREQVVEPWPAG